MDQDSQSNITITLLLAHLMNNCGNGRNSLIMELDLNFKCNFLIQRPEWEGVGAELCDPPRQDVHNVQHHGGDPRRHVQVIRGLPVGRRQAHPAETRGVC